jgi:hypothetical protein
VKEEEEEEEDNDNNIVENLLARGRSLSNRPFQVVFILAQTTTSKNKTSGGLSYVILCRKGSNDDRCRRRGRRSTCVRRTCNNITACYWIIAGFVTANRDEPKPQ